MPLSLEASFPESPDGVFWAGEQLVMTIVVRNDGELPPQTPRMARRRSSGRGGDLVNPFGPEFRDADGQKGDTDAPVGDKRSGTLEAGGYLVRAGTASSTDGSIAGDGTNGDASGQRKPGLISSVVRSVGRGALSLLGLGGSPTEEPGTPTSPSDPSNLHGLPEAPMASPVSPGRDPDIPARSDSFSRALPPAPQLGTVEQPPTVIKLAPVNTALERIDEVRSGSSTPGGPGSPAPSEASFRPPLPLLPAPASLRKLVPTAASGTEQLTYGFVQMVGTLQPDPNSISLAPFGTLKSRAMYFPSSGQHGGGGSLVANTGPRTKDDRAIPVYSTPPSILFVDLNLAPGESKTYRYSLILPEVLPPSHRGRLARFSYKLVIGIQRGAINTRTQNFQVPFRLFSRVEEDFTKPVYDVLDPVVVTADEARVVSAEDLDQERSPVAAREALFDMLRRGYDGEIQSPVDAAEEVERLEYLKHPSLHHAMVACQQNSRVTFDICKNTEHVAQLVLTRTSYRIGDSVVGIIKFHRGTVPCYQISVFLEVLEKVQPDFATAKGLRESRRVLAEHHEFCLNTKRTQVMLPIPTNCTPDFVTTAVSLSYGVRIEFVTGTRDRLATTVNVESDEVVHSHGAPVAEVESFDCTIPIKVFGSTLPKTLLGLSRYLHFTVT